MPPPAEPAPSHRVEAIDLLRGLVMALMALDHVRDYFGVVPTPAQLVQSTPLFLTRWVTHLCAPVFVLLAGVGAALHGARSGDRRALARYLLTRGAWLVVLDLTVVFVGWTFLVPFRQLVLLQVIWVLGWSMILLAGLVFLPRWAILAVALPVVLGHDALSRLAIEVPIAAAGMGPITTPAEQLWCVLHAGMKLLRPAGGWPMVLVIYPLVPWFALMALGYLLGPALREPATRARTAWRWGLALTGGFVVLRFAWPGLDFYQPFEGRGWIDFLDTSKYPPSLPYLLMTVGPALMLLAGMERLRGRLRDWLLVLGRVPLFFYVAHVYLGHLLGLLWVRLRCGEWYWNFMSPSPAAPPTLVEVYGGWLLVLVLLYRPCRWFMDLKRRRRDRWWLSYL